MDVKQRFVIGALDDVPALMTRPERLLLYSLVLGCQPKIYLEIGSSFGGSATIACRAMDSEPYFNEDGRIICVDEKASQIEPETWKRISHRATMHEGKSPAVLADLRKTHEKSVDFALVDGDHTADGVKLDIQLLEPLLTRDAVVLFHDSFNADTFKGIEQGVWDKEHFNGALRSFGTIAKTPTEDYDRETLWGGFYMAFGKGRGYWEHNPGK